MNDLSSFRILILLILILLGILLLMDLPDDNTPSDNDVTLLQTLKSNCENTHKTECEIFIQYIPKETVQ